MTRDVAEQINALMLEYGARLDRSVELVAAHGSGDEISRYKHAVGKILGEMPLEIMNPIYSEYPDLKPPQLERQSAPS